MFLPAPQPTNGSASWARSTTFLRNWTYMSASIKITSLTRRTWGKKASCYLKREVQAFLLHIFGIKLFLILAVTYVHLRRKTCYLSESQSIAIHD